MAAEGSNSLAASFAVPLQQEPHCQSFIAFAHEQLRHFGWSPYSRTVEEDDHTTGGLWEVALCEAVAPSFVLLPFQKHCLAWLSERIGWESPAQSREAYGHWLGSACPIAERVGRYAINKTAQVAAFSASDTRGRASAVYASPTRTAIQRAHLAQTFRDLTLARDTAAVLAPDSLGRQACTGEASVPLYFLGIPTGFGKTVLGSAYTALKAHYRRGLQRQQDASRGGGEATRGPLDQARVSVRQTELVIPGYALPPPGPVRDVWLQTRPRRGTLDTTVIHTASVRDALLAGADADTDAERRVGQFLTHHPPRSIDDLVTPRCLRGGVLVVVPAGAVLAEWQTAFDRFFPRLTVEVLTEEVLASPTEARVAKVLAADAVLVTKRLCQRYQPRRVAFHASFLHRLAWLPAPSNSPEHGGFLVRLDTGVWRHNQGEFSIFLAVADGLFPDAALSSGAQTAVHTAVARLNRAGPLEVRCSPASYTVLRAEIHGASSSGPLKVVVRCAGSVRTVHNRAVDQLRNAVCTLLGVYAAGSHRPPPETRSRPNGVVDAENLRPATTSLETVGSALASPAGFFGATAWSGIVVDEAHQWSPERLALLRDTVRADEVLLLSASLPPRKLAAVGPLPPFVASIYDDVSVWLSGSPWRLRRQARASFKHFIYHLDKNTVYADSGRPLLQLAAPTRQTGGEGVDAMECTWSFVPAPDATSPARAFRRRLVDVLCCLLQTYDNDDDGDATPPPAPQTRPTAVPNGLTGRIHSLLRLYYTVELTNSVGVRYQRRLKELEETAAARARTLPRASQTRGSDDASLWRRAVRALSPISPDEAGQVVLRDVCPGRNWGDGTSACDDACTACAALRNHWRQFADATDVERVLGLKISLDDDLAPQVGWAPEDATVALRVTRGARANQALTQLQARLRRPYGLPSPLADNECVVVPAEPAVPNLAALPGVTWETAVNEYPNLRHADADAADLCCAVCTETDPVDLPGLVAPEENCRVVFPVLLPCGHIFCGGCLQLLVNRAPARSQYTCPLCRSTFNPLPAPPTPSASRSDEAGSRRVARLVGMPGAVDDWFQRLVRHRHQTSSPAATAPVVGGAAAAASAESTDRAPPPAPADAAADDGLCRAAVEDIRACMSAAEGDHAAARREEQPLARPRLIRACTTTPAASCPKQSPKVAAVVRLVAEEVAPTERALVFVSDAPGVTAVTKALRRAFSEDSCRAFALSATTRCALRGEVVRAFNACEGRAVLVTQYSVAAVGLNLQRANHVILPQPCVGAALQQQAVGRIWRLGQTRRMRTHVVATVGSLDHVALRRYARTGFRRDLPLLSEETFGLSLAHALRHELPTQFRRASAS